MTRACFWIGECGYSVLPANGAFECGGIDGKLGGLTLMNSYPRLVCIHGIKITVLSRLR